MMGKPQVEIAVDEASGRWSVDGIPMVLVPQHFFLNNHRAVEAALGTERLAALLRPAGALSARVWCEKEAAFHGLSGADVFRHYMRRLSQRGWAQFGVVALDPAAGRAEIRVDHSIFVGDEQRRAGLPACSMFASWLEGALEYVAASESKPVTVRGREVHCAAEGGHDHCLFRVEPETGLEGASRP